MNAGGLDIEIEDRLRHLEEAHPGQVGGHVGPFHQLKLAVETPGDPGPRSRRPGAR